MHGAVEGLSYAQLIWEYHESQKKLATAQGQLKRLTAENLYIKSKLLDVRDNYNVVEKGLKSMNPHLYKPYYRQAYDPRNLD